MTVRVARLIACFVVLCCVAVSACGSKEKPAAGSRPKVVIVSLLRHPLFDEVVGGVRSGLDNGRFDVVELNANGEMDKLRLLAQEAAALSPQVIVPVSTPVTLAMTAAVRPDQKLVFTFVANPLDVGMGNKPGNMTGVSDQMNYEGVVELIGQLLPKATRIGMVYNSSERNSQFAAERIGAAAKAVGKSLVVAPVANSGGVSDAARSLEGRVDVIAVGSDNTVVSAMPALVRTALESRTPVVAGDSFSVRQGALAAISANYARMGIETARIVTRLIDDPSLRPGSIEALPIRGDTLVINTAAAAKLGYTFPESVRSRAAEVFSSIAD
jgi:putative ABC transport system substrate-binding protein